MAETENELSEDKNNPISAYRTSCTPRIDELQRIIRKPKFSRKEVSAAIQELMGLHSATARMLELAIIDLANLIVQFHTTQDFTRQKEAYYQSLIEALKTNKVITDEDIQKAWLEVIQPKLLKQLQEISQKKEESLQEQPEPNIEQSPEQMA